MIEPEDARFRRVRNEAAQRLHELLEREPIKELKFELTDFDRGFLASLDIKVD